MNLKENAASAADRTLRAGGEATLKAGGNNEENQNTNGSEMLTAAAANEAADMLSNAVRSAVSGSDRRNRQMYESNAEAANRYLVNGADTSGAASESNGQSVSHDHARRVQHQIQQNRSSSYESQIYGGRSGTMTDTESHGPAKVSSGDENFTLSAGSGADNFTLSPDDSGREHLSSRTGKDYFRLSGKSSDGERLTAGSDEHFSFNHEPKDGDGERGLPESGRRNRRTRLASASPKNPTGGGALDFGDKRSTESKISDTYQSKLKDSRRKALQKKLQQEYRVKTKMSISEGVSLMTEQTAVSKIYDTGRFTGAEAAGRFGKKTLHFADNLADDRNGLGIQNAWVDAAYKVVSTGAKVYSLSQTARYWKRNRDERTIARLIKQEDKIAMNNIRFTYNSQLKMARDSELWRNSSMYEKHLQKKAIKRKYMKNAIKEYQEAKKKGAAAKKTYTTGLSLIDQAKQEVHTIAVSIRKFLSSKAGRIMLIILLVLGLLFALFGAVAGIVMMIFGGNEEIRNQTAVTSVGFPQEVLQWQEFVKERCEANNDSSSDVDLTLFVNAILATIEQESGGVSSSCGGDLMQCKASGLWNDAAMPSDWTTEQKSIDVGIRYFYQGLKTWNVTAADDTDGLQMVAQGYNYGFAFLTWAKENSYTKWTLDISSAYSKKQAESLGWSSYGHKEYGEEWLAKYMAGGSAGSGEVVVESGSGGVAKTAQNQIGISEEPAGSNKVVFNTDYYGQEVSGDSYPWCCVFVWWCFNKSGNAAAFYNGGKTASCDAVYNWAQSDGLFISGSEAQYGDLVLFGSNEHIEIVISNNGDGSYTTIGGNTSSDTAGSQSNGGCVALKTRYTTGGFPITSFIRPEY